MQAGNRRKPTISPTSVEATLNTLVYTTTNTSDAATLLSLVIIEEYLHDPTRPPAKNLREFALKSILCSLIEQTLVQYRVTSELTKPSPSDTTSIAIRQIQLDSQQNSADLLGWSYLYYRFVRVDMGISHDTYADYANIETRTLRRYKKYIIARLAEKLIEVEWDARRRQHRTRLLSAIPTDTHRPLIGRESQLQNAISELQNGTSTRCYVTGGIGIGKTAFLAMLTRQLIEAEMLDYLIWLNNPRTVDDVMSAIQEVVLPPHSRLELRDILVTYQLLVIFDDISELSEDPIALTQILDFLAPCIVCMASEQRITLQNPVYHIHLDELNQQQVHTLIQSMRTDTTITNSIANTIWEQVGGNPRAVQLAVLHLSTGNLPFRTADSLVQMYALVFDSLTHAQQLIWMLTATMKDRQLPSQVIDSCIRRGIFSYDDLAHLLKISIVQKPTLHDFFTISQSAQFFVSNTPNFQAIVAPLVDVILSDTHELTNQTLHHFCLQLLLHDALVLAKTKIPEIIRIGWLANRHFRNLYQWKFIFDIHYDILKGNSEIQLAYGVCLRQLNQPQAAQSVFQALIEETGQVGDFSTQAVVLIDMAILYRKQGQYEVAQECLERSRNIESRFPDETMRGCIVTEFAQIELDRNRTYEALMWLDTPEATLLNDMLLKAEVLLLLSQLKECQRVVRQILLELQQTHDFVRLTSLYTLLARSYQQQGNSQKAIDCYNAALSYAEQQQDIFAIARLKSNLATLLIHQDEIETAEQLLIDAEITQESIVDKVGLEATRHNLHYLKHVKAKRS